MKKMTDIENVINSAFHTQGVKEYESVIERLKAMPKNKALGFIKTHLRLMNKIDGTTIIVYRKGKERVEIYMGSWGSPINPSSTTYTGIYASVFPMARGFIIRYYGEGKNEKSEKIILDDNPIALGY